MNQRDLIRRLDRLERQNRTLRRIGGTVGALAVAALVAPFVMGASPVCKTVWAERFVLKDARGQQRGLWDAYTTNGNPSLKLYDANGQACLAIQLDDEGGPSLSTIGEGGELVPTKLERASSCDEDGDSVAMR